MKSLPFLFVALVLSILTSCKDDNKKFEGPLSGDLTIGVDETFSPVAESISTAFMNLYPRARVTCKVRPEVQAVNDLLNDSLPLIIISRDLNTQEKDYFKSRQLNPKVVPLAYDGLVLLTHPDNIDSLLTTSEIEKIMNGSVNQWSQISKKNKLAQLNIVFDNPNSSTVTTLMSKTGVSKLPQNAYALKSNEEVIAYVKEHPSALGVIGMSWIADLNATQKENLGKSVKIVYISKDQSNGTYYKPDQLNISEGKYPYSRTIYAISREPYWGLASSLISYMGGEKGQRIIMKAGLAPTKELTRLVILKDNQRLINN